MKKICEQIKKIFDKFTLTNISSILASIIYCICLNRFELVSDIFLTFLISFCITSFLSETIYNKKNKLYYLLPLMPSVVLTIISRFEIIASSNIYIRFLIFYFLSVILLAIYYNYKNSGKSFPKYLISCFSNLLKVGIIYLVLNIGMILILLLIDFLIVPGAFSNLVEYIFALIIGIYLVPASTYAIYKYEDVGNFINILVTKVFFILVLIAYLIVYVYIFIILVTLSLPVNTLFPMLLILFIISTVTNVMGLENENNKLLIKIHSMLPYLFMPFLLLQIYSLGVRVIPYGLTITRYLGIMAIIFEIIYIIFHFTKKDLGLLTYVIIIEFFITLILPFINCYDLSISSQYQRLIEFKNTNQVTEKIKGAYDYLNDYDKGKKRINKLLSKEEKEIIESYISESYENTNVYSYYEETDFFDISEYNMFKMVLENYKDNQSESEIMNRVVSCINGNENNCFENNNIIMDESSKKIIKSAYCYYDNKVIEYCDFEYYLLMK